MINDTRQGRERERERDIGLRERDGGQWGEKEIEGEGER